MLGFHAISVAAISSLLLFDDATLFRSTGPLYIRSAGANGSYWKGRSNG